MPLTKALIINRDSLVPTPIPVMFNPCVAARSVMRGGLFFQP